MALRVVARRAREVGARVARRIREAYSRLEHRLRREDTRIVRWAKVEDTCVACRVRETGTPSVRWALGCVERDR